MIPIKNPKLALIIGLVVLGVIGAVFASFFIQYENKTHHPVFAPEVVIAPAVQKDIPVYLEFIGQTYGYQDVEIRARVEGYLNQFYFKEGSLVKKGDLLYQIDPQTFQAALDKAKGELGIAQARFEKSQNDVNRYKPLVEQDALSKQELDTAMAALDATKAEVDAAKAAVEQAQLNLGYTHIEAPISGLIDVSQVKSGNLVGRGENTLLTTISQIDPIDVKVNVSETDYLVFAKKRAERGDDRAGPDYPIELYLADQSQYPFSGAVRSVERSIDSNTGTLAVKISFPNPKNILRPGQYAKVRVTKDMQKGAILVPQRAVQEIQGVYRVAVVGDGNKVSVKNVGLGNQVGNMYVITSGLKGNETVIVEGIQKVQDGMVVQPKQQAVQPESNDNADTNDASSLE